MGKIATYLFALFLCGLLLAFCFEEREAGGGGYRYRLKADPPIGLLAILLPTIGVCLGVQLSPESVGNAIGKITKG